MNETLPPVEIVDMREELREGNRSMFSRALHDKIQDRLAKKEQTVLFLNRDVDIHLLLCAEIAAM